MSSTGFAVIPAFLDSNSLAVLRAECRVLVEAARDTDAAAADSDAQWAATSRGCIFETVSGQHAGAAEFMHLRRRWPLQPAAADLLFGPALRQLVQAALGTTSFLFNDQYIVKPPQSPLSQFMWHRDSDWMNDADVERHPYISVWIALDDATEENGCLVVAPLAANGRSSPDTAEVTLLEVAAGTAVVMTDRLLHCSSPNLSAHTRAAWMPQFSAEPIRYRATDGGAVGRPLSLAIAMAEE